MLFLAACRRLYKPLCRSIGWSVRRSETDCTEHATYGDRPCFLPKSRDELSPFSEDWFGPFLRRRPRNDFMDSSGWRCQATRRHRRCPRVHGVHVRVRFLRITRWWRGRADRWSEFSRQSWGFNLKSTMMTKVKLRFTIKMIKVNEKWLKISRDCPFLKQLSDLFFYKQVFKVTSGLNHRKFKHIAKHALGLRFGAKSTRKSCC